MKHLLMLKTPILFIIFNRPYTTQKVFESIRIAKPERLYIAGDAPRQGNYNDIQKCQQTREIVQNINWPCEVKYLFQEKNLGCSLGPRAAFDWFFSFEEQGIILEDDCVPNESFFDFCSEMLKRYRDNKRIISINGSSLGFNLKNSDSNYTYSRFMNMWGWATWADRASSIDYSLKEWRKVKQPLWYLYRHMRQNLFDFDIHWYKYWQHKFDLTVYSEKVTWWDWQWIFHQITNNQLSVVPSVNLVTNIGFNEDATHTLASDNPSAYIPFSPLETPYFGPERIAPDFRYEEEFVKWVWCYHKRLPVSFYIKQYVKKLIYKK